MKRVTWFMGILVTIALSSLAVVALNAAGWKFARLILWGIGLTFAGMAVGFLFGIPKVMQGQVSQAASDKSGEGNGDYKQRVNTNLEEISDWLTKIIVGFGLIQLQTIPEKIALLGASIGSSLGEAPTYQSIGIAVVITFPTIGFLYGYLITRLYISGAFARAEGAAFEKDVKETLKNVARRIEQQGMMGGQPDPGAIAALWADDPSKGKFGGSAVANGRRLSARITPWPASPQVCDVVLTVESTDAARPLSSPVVFHLHPTFKEKAVEVDIRGGKAELSILAMGAFTVGAVADEGATKLELDLATVEGASSEFRAH